MIRGESMERRQNRTQPMTIEQFRALQQARPAQMQPRPPMPGGGQPGMMRGPVLRPPDGAQLPAPRRPAAPMQPEAPPAEQRRPIGSKEVAKAGQILQRYKAAKARTEQRIIASELWWKRRHWEYMDQYGNPYDHRPASAWLFNCVMSKHADAIEAYPEPNILPREPGDKKQARMLTHIVPVVLEQNDYEETYSQTSWQKLKQGTGISGVFWDPTRHNGLGDIAVRRIDALNIYPEPGVGDIQQCRNVFTTELVDIDVLRENYPEQLRDRQITGKGLKPSEYIYDDNIRTEDKAVVVDWYYKRRRGGRSVLHYVKFVDDVVLYASENDPRYAERGHYDHGLYPFVFDPLFPVEGSLFGYGYIDVGKDSQETIDRLNQAIEKNAIAGAQPRWFIRNGSDVNEKEFADFTKPFVHVGSGSLGEDSIRQIAVDPLPGIYTNILEMKIEEMKETTGNRDAANGGTQTGVTAASAIAAMQEMAGKTSRASTRSSYRAYARMINMVIELIRQFYDMPRQYRIIGNSGQEEFVEFSNEGIRPQHQGMMMGEDMGYRLPVFDVEVSTEKMTAYTKIAQNELALQMYNLGFFNPEQADQALTVLDIMDFDHKDLIEDKIRKNQTMQQQLAMYQQLALQQSMELAKFTGRGDMVEALAAQIMGSQQQLGNEMSGAAAASAQMANGIQADPVRGMLPEEHPFVQKARAQAGASTQVGG